MEFQICTGKYEAFGVTKVKDILSFSLQAGDKATCNLLLYPKEAGKVIRIPMERHREYSNIYTVGVQGLDDKQYDYNYEIDGREITDPYAVRITGRELWADPKRRPREESATAFVPEKIKKRQEKMEKEHEKKIKSSFYFSNFNWKNDVKPEIAKEDMVIYKLHARGFTMGMKTENSNKGTFGMLEQKLTYFKELGITGLLFMPVYEFEELLMLDKSKRQEHPQNLINYWGYTVGSYFAPKASYLGIENNPDTLKQLIQKIHRMGMEFFAEFYFDKKINPHLIIDVMRYWKREYHVDGFRVICDSYVAELLAQDSCLSGCKLFYEGFSEEFAERQERFGPELFSYNDSFLYEMRKILNHQGGDVYKFACQMKRQQEHQGFVNFVAENNGFTLWDLFSYSKKHNEENLEENRDGNDWNYSTNSGQEGNSKKREINRLRERKVKNALAVTVFSQGIPMLWMGDECANTQNGNNNAYCQDNETGWKDWKNTKISREITTYLKEILKIRKVYPLLRNPKPYQMEDYKKQGYPDLSYHSEGAWQMDFERNRGFIGIFYCGAYGGAEHLYLAYNFQNVSQEMALPQEIGWRVLMDTGRSEVSQEVRTGTVRLEAQSVVVLSGKEIKEKVERKNGKIPKRN